MKRPFIGYGRQSIGEADIDAVAAVLRSDFLTQGPMVERFEAALADYVGAQYAVVVANGTAALYLACAAAGLGAGQPALTQAITFVATANAPRFCGAALAIGDIDAEGLGLSAAALRSWVAGAPPNGVVLPVHMAGYSADPAGVRSLAAGHVIIEDACHALGASEPDGARVGSCRHSDMACFSFHPVKSLTTGEGGAITTNDAELARKLRLLRNHGLEREPARWTATGRGGSEAGSWYYEQQELGLNFRLTDIQAALGLSQLKRLDEFVARRRHLAGRYDAAFAGQPHLRPLQASADARRRSAHHLYLLDIDFAAIGKSRQQVMEALRARSVGTQVHYIPLHHHPFHRDAATLPARCPEAERYYSGCLSIPLYPGLSDDDADYVSGCVKEICGR